MDFWSRSDGASAFTRPDYLAQLVDEVEWWGVERSGEVVAGWPIVRAVAGGHIGPPAFCYYIGPMFARSLRQARYARYWSVYTDSFSALVDAVVSTHPQFTFSVPLGVTDLRVLEWWNFDHPGRAGFEITPRYTARIDLSELPDAVALRRSFASTRRRDIDRWQAIRPAIADHVATERVIELHDQALIRSGAAASSARLTALRRLIALVQSGAGSIVGAVPPGEEQVEAVIILLDGPTETNTVFYAASEHWRARGLTAWATWEGLLLAQSQGKRWFDFNGANSPRRAADKHFYGAKAELYFDCSFGLAGGRPPA